MDTTYYQDHFLYPYEVFELYLFMGSLVYFFGAIIRFWWLTRWWGRVRFLSILIIVVALFVSAILTMFIDDFLYNCIPKEISFINDLKKSMGIFMPAMLSELCLFAVQGIVFMFVKKRRNHVQLEK